MIKKPEYYIISFNKVTFQGKLEKWYLSKPIKSTFYMEKNPNKAWKIMTEKSMSRSLDKLANFGQVSNITAEHVYL